MVRPGVFSVSAGVGAGSNAKVLSGKYGISIRGGSGLGGFRGAREEADGASRERVLEALDILHDGNENRAMLSLRLLQLIDFLGEGLVTSQMFSHSHEGPHNENVHLVRALALEDGGEHRYTVLGEGVGLIAAAAVA
jgi:hypothetical protein